MPAPVAAARADASTRYASLFTFLSAVAGLASIAVSHLCLGLAAATATASRTRLRLPPVWLPLAGFLGWTVLSLLASGDPAAGAPQVKKFFVFLILPLVYTFLHDVRDARRLAQAWFIVAAVAVAVAIGQFVTRWAAAHRGGVDFLAYYAPDRITGFFSHWMTFSQAVLLIFVLLASYLLFGRSVRRGRPVWLLLGLILLVGLLLSFTRSVWLALLALSAYFLLVAKPRLLWAAPILVLAAALLAPEPIRQRARSIADPAQNEARLLMWRTGLRMIAAHPVLGVGPERVGPLFGDYMPPRDAPPPEAYYGHLHNIYIHYGAERGLPAAGFLLWFLLQTMWDAAKALRRLLPEPDDRRFLLHGAVGATLAVMLVGLFDVTLGDSEVLGVYLAVVGLGYAARDAVEARPPHPRVVS